MEQNQSRKLILVIFAALFAAMTFALTFSIKMPMPGGGYIHLGDTVIYLAACLLPTPYAMLAAGIGGALSDLAGGYMQYILPTFLIKMLIALPFTAKKDTLLNKRNVVMPLISGVITVAGYYMTYVGMLALSDPDPFTKAFFANKTWIAALSNIPENIIQAAGSMILFYIIAFAFDRISLKDKMTGALDKRY